jgi:hypothetical protein
MRMTIRRSLAAWIAAAALAGLPAATAPDAHARPVAVAAAKPCSAGYTHAIISGEHKCLRRGQFCARSADRQYRRYGFRCSRYDANVNRYRLT